MEMSDNKATNSDWMFGLEIITLAANDVFGFNQWKFIETKNINV